MALNLNKARPQPASNKCEAFLCEGTSATPVSLCLNCSSIYCDNCWERQGPHQAGKFGPDGLPHEKTNKDIYDRLTHILNPPEDDAELHRLHWQDESTTWFGIEKDTSGNAIFYDHGRFANLMANTKQPSTGSRYPQLVSFVGETGAGKSTLIKMLVSLREHKLNHGAQFSFETPVVGSVKNDKSPTSCDVHLYVDPETAYTRQPMLYADCEGLQGGETEPAARKMRKANKRQKISKKTRESAHRAYKVISDDIKERAGGREFGTRKVYPRLLYTFSDVIVFVLRNARTFESSVLKLLLEWASTSLESSINQPTLPHAIIVLNATNPGVDSDEWDTKTATERLMRHVADAVYENPRFKNFADHWRKKGRKINSMLDLLHCYYADLCVIRIPQKGRYMLTNTQVHKLHHKIELFCNSSFHAKADAHMLSNVEELQTYLQAGFDHFTSKNNEPFNFVEVALRNHPVPRDFGDHILALAAKARDITNIPDGPRLFRSLSNIVASCIFIDCIRASRPGKAVDLFDNFYASSCIAALEHFCDKNWPCSFKNHKGACVNVKLSHEAKGHQNASGKIISYKSYESSFTAVVYSDQWVNLVKNRLQGIEIQFQNRRNAIVPSENNPSTMLDRNVAYQIHRTHVSGFFRWNTGFSAQKYISQTTCYCCLMEVPVHPLQCGHFLCTGCVKAYGHQHDSHTMLITCCPLHPSEIWDKPWVIHFKPEYAGVRVLTLDGGGIRGILELEVLRAIEVALGGVIPIQAFFDLIIGTSTGGIIALGLGVKQWTVNQCITEFVRLCSTAFIPRDLSPILTFYHTSKYKSRHLHQGLYKALGNDPLYGGSKKAGLDYTTQVAVTATSSTGETGLLLANYSRYEENEPAYRFAFPHNLQIWEAACATSAAPKFFSAFQQKSHPKRQYLDGALYHNNPASVANNERKLLWPDVAENPPDILLSLGTGKYGERLKDQIAEYDPSVARRQQMLRSSNSTIAKSKQRTQERQRNLETRSRFSFKPKFFKTLIKRAESILDTEIEWKRFRSENQDTLQDQEQDSRFVRVNLDLWSDPPKLDEVHRLSELQDTGIKLLEKDENKRMIERIAYRLVASTFYFSKKRFWFNEESGIWTCSGQITCRFEGALPDAQKNMRALGDFLRKQQSSGYQPFFTINAGSDTFNTTKVPITEQTIESMINRAEFRFSDPIFIYLPLETTSTTLFLSMRSFLNEEVEFYPLSGFPRYLIIEDAINEQRLDKRAERIKARRFNHLPVANDPRVFLSSEKRDGSMLVSGPVQNEQQATNAQEDRGAAAQSDGIEVGEGPKAADKSSLTAMKKSQTPSHTTLSSDSEHSTNSAREALKGVFVSTVDLRKQYESLIGGGPISPVSPIAIGDDKNVAEKMKIPVVTVIEKEFNEFGLESPDFGSDLSEDEDSAMVRGKWDGDNNDDDAGGDGEDDSEQEDEDLEHDDDYDADAMGAAAELEESGSAE